MFDEWSRWESSDIDGAAERPNERERTSQHDVKRERSSRADEARQITEDVRKFAAEQKLSDDAALQAGMEKKAREFTEAGSEIYSKI